MLSEDFYKRLVKKSASSKEILWASRIGVILFSGLAFFMAYGQSATIMSIVEYAWSGLGSAFGPLLLYMKDTNGNAVNLTSWQVFSQARNNVGQKIDLKPVITNAVTGEVTIQFNYTETPNFKSGDQPYDLIFRFPKGGPVSFFPDTNQIRRFSPTIIFWRRRRRE